MEKGSLGLNLYNPNPDPSVLVRVLEPKASLSLLQPTFQPGSSPPRSPHLAACPHSPIKPAALYLVAHHTCDQSALPFKKACFNSAGCRIIFGALCQFPGPSSVLRQLPGSMFVPVCPSLMTLSRPGHEQWCHLGVVISATVNSISSRIYFVVVLLRY